MSRVIDTHPTTPVRHHTGVRARVRSGGGGVTLRRLFNNADTHIYATDCCVNENSISFWIFSLLNFLRAI